MHIYYIDPVKSKNDTVNDSVKIDILQHLQRKPSANYTELAKKTGYSAATIKLHIQELKKLGVIEHRKRQSRRLENSQLKNIEANSSDKCNFFRLINFF